MPIEIAAFRPAKVRILEITYCCDLTRADGEVVPLGVLIDLSAQGAYGLGLAARRTLSNDESQKIGRLMRAELAAPFAHLLKVFNSVYENATPVDAFGALAEEHTHSLRFHRVQDLSISLPRPLVTNLDARLLWVKDQLVSYGNGAYWKLFSEHMPDVVDKAQKDEARELDRAA